MKILGLILTFTFYFSALGRDLPKVADIKWKCEEGVGNLEHPEPIILISGKFETSPSRQFSFKEKEKLSISIYKEGQFVELHPSQFEVEWENDDEYQALIIKTEEITYKIETLPGNALILRVIQKGLFGQKIQIGSC